MLVIELQGALFFGSAERLAQIVESETAREQSPYCLTCGALPKSIRPAPASLAMSTLALSARGVKLALVLSVRTETAARLADIFQRDCFFPDIDRAIEWAEDDLLRKTGTGPSWNCRLIDSRSSRLHGRSDRTAA